MKILLFATVFFLAVSSVTAQQWSGINDQTSPISRSGNVGIGTTAHATYKLSVQGEIHVNRDYPYLQFNSSYWNSSSFIQTGVTHAAAANGNYMVFYNPSSKGYNFRQGGMDALTILPTGLVGINNASPEGRLDIKAAGGQLRLSGGTVAAGVWTNYTDQLYLADWATGKNGVQVNLSNGNVGIGTFNADTRLTVNGKIKAEEVQVVVDVPADYVFDSDYKLMPLAEVAKFIQKNRHLPSVPSAAEIKEVGWNVGEMNNKMLEKIEELTLYIIQQNELIETLQQSIAQQQKQIETLNSKID
jgi:hypothetical protein